MYFPISDVTVSPVLLALLGMIVGTMTGFFGVGGGFLITGGLLVLGVPTIYAIGTGLLMVMGTAITSTLRHRRLGNVDVRLAALIVCGTIPGVFAGERVNRALDDAGIAGPVVGVVYFALLLSLGGLMVGNWLRQIRYRPRRQVGGGLPGWFRQLRLGPARLRLPGRRTLNLRPAFPNAGIAEMSAFTPMFAGCVIGFIAALLGAGGGFLLMPFLVYGLGVPPAVAIGTDLFQIIITGTLGAFLYSLNGSVDPIIAVIMFASASVGTQLGALTTRFVNASRILGLFGVTVLNAGIAVGLGQLGGVLDSPRLSPLLEQISQALLLGVSGLVALTILLLLLLAAAVRARRGRRLARLRAARRRRTAGEPAQMPTGV